MSGVCDAGTPSNDKAASAIAMSGAAGSVSGTTAYATMDASGPSDLESEFSIYSDASVWYKYTATSTGLLRLRVSAAVGGNDVVVFAAASGAVVARAERCEDEVDSIFDALSRCALAPIVRGGRYLVRIITSRVAFTLTWSIVGECRCAPYAERCSSA